MEIQLSVQPQMIVGLYEKEDAGRCRQKGIE